jgi:beta-glucosidase
MPKRRSLYQDRLGTNTGKALKNERRFLQFVPCSPTKAHYSEKLEVGYRWYDVHGVKPAFAFGSGLSYTTFAYSSLSVNGRTVSFTLTNTGKVKGAEVSQLYLTYPSAAGQPFKQLRGFVKTLLDPGARQLVTFDVLSDRWLSNWDTASHSWKLAEGEFVVGVGGSSDDLPLKGKLTV